MRVTTENNDVQEAENSFVTSPRKMMSGSWPCADSPKTSPEKSASSDAKLTIEVRNSEERGDSGVEEREASHDETPRGGETGQRTGHASGTPMSSMSPAARFECDYDTNPTDVFLELQRKEWVSAAKRVMESPEEARTWVSRKEKHGKLRWRLLPIHAAIIFKAPEDVVEALLAAFPKGAQSKDDQGMLPLHLAFRHGSSEGTVNLLLVAFPQSVEVKDRKGRIPLVLAQASASANRDAFVRALERGPTYYANAAAATERAAVMAEQRAIFDSKLIEVEKKHQQDIKHLKEERNGLSETVEMLQKELSKQKGARQVLVDHINSLEAQLKNKGETERFLAVKAATLDTNLNELAEEKEKMQEELEAQLSTLKEENAKLMEEIRGNGQANSVESKTIKDKAAKQEKELKTLKMDWASAQARAAVLEAQLKSKIENEHELASQVSHLAGKLAESAAETGNASTLYSKRVQTLEEERKKLRATVQELGKKLMKVSQFMNKMTQKTQETSKKSSEEARQKQLQLLEEAADQEKLIRKALEDRKNMSAMLKQQEEEMERSAKQHQEILQKLADLKNRAPSPPTDGEGGVPFSSSLTEEMKEMMGTVLSGMPQSSSSMDSDFLETIMQNAQPKKTTSADSDSDDDDSDDDDDDSEEVRMPAFKSQYQYSSDSDDEEDAEKCLQQALRALEQSRTKSDVSAGKKAVPAAERVTSISCNPSDEETAVHNEGMGNQTFSEDSS